MKIGLVPISGKPVHAGHWGLIEFASRANDEVFLYVSTSDRARKGEKVIRGADMALIWKNYLEPELPTNVKVTYGGSPIGNLYKDLIAADEAGNPNIYTIYSDEEDIQQYTDTALQKYAPILFENQQILRQGIKRSQTVDISGTKMRNFLEFDDEERFIAALPPPVRKFGGDIYDILRRSA